MSASELGENLTSLMGAIDELESTTAQLSQQQRRSSEALSQAAQALTSRSQDRVSEDPQTTSCSSPAIADD